MQLKAALTPFVFGILGILTTDILGSLAAVQLDISYYWFALVSLVNYAVAGHFIWRVSGMWTTILLTAAMGIFDGSAGFYIAAKLGAYGSGFTEAWIVLGMLAASISMIFMAGAFGALVAAVSKEYFPQHQQIKGDHER
ncbi:hypothetical protein [Flavihumibacter petaseus]|uniref:Uncharacterized protein n=1 Tax=Flavihumibacter petaseus NBRC 106054 TaxID=1220578 RepID=A0A0E9N345_9BACT|nr:hypothetical protein [Flavihumibacter petaseus]GAO44218.1 hypothetical protein FPE01S_03_02560 [Flavihumibacter petaseus NBRC 106054]